MKVFIAKLRDIIGTERHPVSMAPRDVLFEHQRHFLEKHFDTKGVRHGSLMVDVPKDGSPILFRCDISTRMEAYNTVSRIVEADWGDFTVRKVFFANADKDGKDYDWLKASFFVGLRGEK